MAKKVKVFDTISVRKIIQDHYLGGLNEEIDNELQDFFENDIMILPVFKRELKRWCVVILRFSDDKMLVELYDRKRKELSEAEVDKYNFNLSVEMQDFVERAFWAHCESLKEDKIEGSVHYLEVENEVDMIPAVLQIAENIVLYQKVTKPETAKQIRHKITDRLISLYLLE